MTLQFPIRVHEVTQPTFSGAGPVQLNGTPSSPAGRRERVA